MKTLNNIELIPHLTLDPIDEHIHRDASQISDLWNCWERIYSDFRISGIYTDYENSLIIPVRYVKDNRTLAELLKVSVQTLQDSEEDIEFDLLFQSVTGGLSLFRESTLIYETQCCSDLGNINDWVEILTYRKSEWTLLWNGHPMIPVRYADKTFHFAKNSDNAPSSKGAGKYIISVDVLKTAVNQASQEVQGFQDRLYTYWTEHQDEIWR